MILEKCDALYTFLQPISIIVMNHCRREIVQWLNVQWHYSFELWYGIRPLTKYPAGGAIHAVQSLMKEHHRAFSTKSAKFIHKAHFKQEKLAQRAVQL